MYVLMLVVALAGVTLLCVGTRMLVVGDPDKHEATARALLILALSTILLSAEVVYGFVTGKSGVLGAIAFLATVLLLPLIILWLLLFFVRVVK